MGEKIGVRRGGGGGEAWWCGASKTEKGKQEIWTKMKAFVSIICVDGALFG